MPAPTQPPTSSEALWRRFRTQLHRFLSARLPSEADADDVLQDVFLRLHEGAASLDAVDDVRAWLYRIARHAVADFYRTHERRAAEIPQPLDEAMQPGTPESELPDGLSVYTGPHDVHEEVLSWLRPMIDDLPDMYRIPLHLADVEGKTQQDVADLLGLSLSGAKSRVQRARRLLGEMLRRCCALEFSSEGRVEAFRRLRPADSPCNDHCTDEASGRPRT